MTFDGILRTAYIARDLGQAMMNKAAGGTAPTWYLMVNPLLHGIHRVDAGSPPIVWSNGVRYMGVQSYVPLLWILKHPPSEWEFIEADDGIALEVNVPVLPPPNLEMKIHGFTEDVSALRRGDR